MNTRRATLIILILFTSRLFLMAQEVDTWHEKPELTLSGFLDIYYVYDFNLPQGTSRQPFLYNHNRHNEFNLNVGLLKLGVDHKKYRANFALQSGTYANDNYAAEPGVLKNIFEANVGISMSRNNKLWLDAGIFSSHLGVENPISIYNMTLTRSLSAEGSPYFLTGAKITYYPSEKLEIAGLILNGWQRIQRVPGNSIPSFGSQILFKPSDKITLNWSTFLGTDDPDSTRRMRIFNNLYGQLQFSEKFGMIAGFDFGRQSNIVGTAPFYYWLSPTLIAQWSLHENWKIAARTEYYQDPDEVIISTQTANGFQTLGFSINLDYAPSPNVLCRIEGRMLNSKDNIFESPAGPRDYNYIIGASMAVRFSEQIKK